jgi:phosphinothricin acetyltransferase
MAVIRRVDGSEGAKPCRTVEKMSSIVRSLGCWSAPRNHGDALVGTECERGLMKVTIRPARQADLPAITDIYNEAILTTTATFDTETKTVEQQQDWFEEHGPDYPLLVAELDGSIVGWTCLSKWSDRRAYRETAESSTYVKQDYRGRGIGRQLKAAIDRQSRRLGFHTVLARITQGSDASLHLNRQFGFELVGVMKEVGFKFGKRLDVYLLQKIYDADSDVAE